MTITKNDFFTANNFKTLQDIGKKVYLLTKDEVNTLVQDTQTLYLYNRAK